MTTTDPIAAFLGEGDYDGEKSEALKFPTLGTTHRGTISKEPKVIETEDKFGKNGGRPVQKLLVTLTIEGTEYALWVQGQMRQAIKEAIDAAGRGLAVGGVLAVKYAEDKDTGKPQPDEGLPGEVRAAGPGRGARRRRLLRRSGRAGRAGRQHGALLRWPPCR